MSWSYSTTIEAGADFDFDAIKEVVTAQNPDGLDQIDAAMTAVHLLMQDNSFGDVEEFYVLMAGHANPGHKPREGWAKETITVSVAVHK